ncbi:MAG: NAD(P)/FAD-dependent oxidoreductase, partial [Actinobacteria bacterium]|nr:NAD(P)/FAD-dependent oxidoreductase [Actinomycetota bacterium]NIX24309.1 NAD(P)/FAD-dependent oxidoreductase [Actinomycetota bacterium]
MTRNGGVAGVRLDDGTEIPSSTVISTAGAIETARMLGDAAPDAPSYRTPGPAHVSLYLGFKGDVEDLGATRYCQ